MIKHQDEKKAPKVLKLSFLFLLTLILTLYLGMGSFKEAQAQEPECPPGFDWQRMSGVGCVQSNCLDIPFAKLSYTSACICLDGYKGCYEPVDSTGVACGPNCPASRLIACVQPDAACPGEEAAPTQDFSEPSIVIPGEETVEEPTGELPSEADLFSDLENFLAGEGITSPTPGQITATGLTLSALLGTWVLINLLSGVPVKTSLQTIDAWRRGQPPGEPIKEPTPTTEKPPEESKPQPTEISIKAEKPPVTIVEPPPKTPETAEPPVPEAVQPPEPSAPSKTPPPGETSEDRALRTVKDAQDLDDALKNTRKQFEAFEEKIPESVRKSDEWKNLVEPKLDKIKNLLKQGELDKGRTWLDRLEQLIKLRDDINRDLSYLPSDKQEAVVWTERTLKTLSHFASDTYQRLVIDPAKKAGEAILPADYAKRWNKSMDELGKALSDVGQQISELPRKGTRLMTHGKLQDQANEMLQSKSPGMRQQGQDIRDLYGPREVPVEYPDFWGKGTKKVRDLWDSSFGKLFK